MSKFAPKTTPAPNSPNDDSRTLLAAAIDAAKRATSVVDALEKAESEGFERKMELSRRLADLRERHAKAEAGATDSFIASLGADSALDALAVLDAPGEKRAAEIADVEREIEALARIRREIESRVEPARDTAKDAEKRVDQCARTALAAEVDVETLLREARDATSWIIARRSLFLFLLQVMPDGEAREEIAHFLSRPWLEPEISGAWERHPSLKPYADALARLRKDSGAVINIAP